MNQFVVPQFIDTEPKIIGPVTVRQFVIVLLGGFVTVMAYKFADLALFIIELLFIAVLVFLFGFFKVNGRPFHFFLLNVIETIKKPSLRVWRSLPDKELLSETMVHQVEVTEVSGKKAPVNKSRLKELTLIVDTGGMFRR